MPAWFAGLDYYLVTSDSEGGPIPVLEAIAAGVPVIAPDVGFCWEYPVIRYSGIDELRRTLEWLGAKRDPARAAVRRLENLIVSWLASKGMTWREAKAV
jgi:glycosyltransferase involved in cell wall biosynthesis